MLKRLLILCLIFTLIPWSFSFAQTNSKSKNEYYEISKGLIEAVSPKSIHTDDGDFTRLEFASALVALMGDMEVSDISLPFLDVDANDENAKTLSVALGAGIVSRAEHFNPDDSISYQDAITMSVRLLGYNNLAIAYGGYPSGYFRVANDLDLCDEISIDNASPLSYTDGTVLMHNVLNAEILEAIGVQNGDIVYNRQEGRSFLAHYHNIYTASGIISANQHSGLYDKDENASKGQFKIGSLSFKGDCDSLLGLNSKVYYTDDRYRTAVYVHSYQNKLTVVDDSLSPELLDTSFSYSPDGVSLKKLNLKLNYALIYNGKAITPSLFKTLTKGERSYKLADNDMDGKIDVVIVNELEYMLVARVDTAENIIYDKYKNYGALILSDTEASFSVYDESGKSIDISAIKKDSVISYCKSYDGLLCKIKLYDKTVVGNINEAGPDNTIYIDSVPYKLSSYYTGNISAFTLGSKAICYLGENDKIIYIEEFIEDEMGYAYLVGADKSASISGDVQIKLFTDKGEMIVLPLADKLKLDDATKTKKEVYDSLASKLDTSAIELIVDKDERELETKKHDAERMIKYCVGSDGSVKRIALADRATDISTINKPQNAYEGPEIYISDECYRRDGYFAPHFTGDSSTVIIRVPVSLDLKNEDENYEILDISYFDAGGATFLTAYDVDAGGYSGLVLFSSDEKGELDEYTASAVVEKMYQTIDPEGDVCWALDLFAKNSWGTYYATESSEADVKKVSPGDIVRVGVTGGNRIKSLKFDYDISANSAADKIGEMTGAVGRSIEYMSGIVYSQQNGHLILVKDDVDHTMPISPNMAKSMITNISKTVFVKLIRNRDGDVISAQTYKEESLDYIKTYLQCGDDADFVVTRLRYKLPALVVVYTNLE